METHQKDVGVNEMIPTNKATRPSATHRHTIRATPQPRDDPRFHVVFQKVHTDAPIEHTVHPIHKVAIEKVGQTEGLQKPISSTPESSRQ